MTSQLFLIDTWLEQNCGFDEHVDDVALVDSKRSAVQLVLAIVTSIVQWWQVLVCMPQVSHQKACQPMMMTQNPDYDDTTTKSQD